MDDDANRLLMIATENLLIETFSLVSIVAERFGLDTSDAREAFRGFQDALEVVKDAERNPEGAGGSQASDPDGEGS